MSPRGARCGRSSSRGASRRQKARRRRIRPGSCARLLRGLARCAGELAAQRRAGRAPLAVLRVVRPSAGGGRPCASAGARAVPLPARRTGPSAVGARRSRCISRCAAADGVCSPARRRSVTRAPRRRRCGRGWSGKPSGAQVSRAASAVAGTCCRAGAARASAGGCRFAGVRKPGARLGAAFVSAWLRLLVAPSRPLGPVERATRYI